MILVLELCSPLEYRPWKIGVIYALSWELLDHLQNENLNNPNIQNQNDIMTKNQQILFCLNVIQLNLNESFKIYIPSMRPKLGRSPTVLSLGISLSRARLSVFNESSSPLSMLTSKQNIDTKTNVLKKCFLFLNRKNFCKKCHISLG